MRKFLNNQSGATAIEYGFLAGMIAVVLIGAWTAIGTSSTVQLADVLSYF